MSSGGQGGQVGSGGSGNGGQTGAGGEGAGGSGAGGAIADAGPDAAGTDCHPACGSGQICVGSGVQGGAVFFADGGVCPAGRHAQGQICVQDLTWACKALPSGCNGTATCACASSLCTQGSCNVPSPDELTCILAVP